MYNAHMLHFTHPAKLSYCVYRGSRATCRDHVLPYFYRKSTLANPNMKFLVACCNPCNTAAGSILFPTFHAKLNHLLTIANHEGRVQWNGLVSTVPHVKNYLLQLENGKSIAHLDAELLPIGRRSPYCYGKTKTDQKRRRATNDFDTPLDKLLDDWT